MATAKFIHEGKMIDYTPSVFVPAGTVVAIGSFVTVAKHDIAANTLGAVSTSGIFDVAKTAASQFNAGEAVYWDNDANPAVGESGSGAATTAAAGNKYMGLAIAAAGTDNTTVRVLLRSMEAAVAEALGLAQLSDVGSVGYTAGNLLIADGDSYEARAVSGDITLAGSGAAALNDAHAEQIALIPIENLAAGADIAARPVFVHPRNLNLVSIGILTQGAPAGVNDSNTAVITLANSDSETVVTATYNTANQPPSNGYAGLGALQRTFLAAQSPLMLSVTQGTTADLPALVLVVRYIPVNA